MCGIDLWFTNTGYPPSDDEDVPEWLTRRGPDHLGTVSTSQLRLRASVLSMRNSLCRQPIACSDTQWSYLAWNGEIFRIFSEDGSQVEDTSSMEVSDTQLVAETMRAILLTSSSPDEITSNLARYFGRIDGEFSFVLATINRVYYGRDKLGRRSLLEWISSDKSQWRLSSVADANSSSGEDGDSWSEVQPGKVYSQNLVTGETKASNLADIGALPIDLDFTLWPDTTKISPEKHGWTAREAEAVSNLHCLLYHAVQRRITPNEPVAILFSGGLDSVVLAGLAAEMLDEVLLVNVDFVDSPQNKTGETSAALTKAADTLAALKSYAELKALYPNTVIRLVQHTATWSDIQGAEERIRHLIHPKTTTMDLNIATALWFAAKTASNDKLYKGRILLTGLGADEWYGGYTRHWTAYQKKGIEGFKSELLLDQSRLWDRNLGRDDRIYSDTSQEARFPYLDASVTSWASDLHPELCCRLELPQTYGNKWILRQVATHMGLTAASMATKRAIQFGSRLAHVSDKQRFGSRRKSKGVSIPKLKVSFTAP